MKLDVIRGAIVVARIDVNDTMPFDRSLMQEHRISVPKLNLSAPLNIQINDFILYKGVKYTLNTVPELVITNRFEYDLVFEGPEYTLFDKLLLDNGDADFTFYGDPSDHLNLLLQNINIIDPGWTAGTVDALPEMFVSYQNVSCRVALGNMADEFKLEYSFQNKQINLTKQVGNVTTLSFEYGMHKGLYSLTRSYVDEMNIKTKVYGFGSTRNLPAGYRGGASRLMFNDIFVENNTGLYGVKETQFTDEEIYPYREGAITAVSAITADTNTFTITDPTLEFNINSFLLSTPAKVRFQTGDLIGEEFEITNYNHATKVITLKAFTNSANIKLPSPTFLPVIGDIYSLFDIGLPSTYIDNAELRLKNATIAYTQQNSVPRVIYSLEMDIMFVRDNNISLNPGDIVTVKHVAAGINDQIRVTSVSYPVSFPENLTEGTKYVVTIANFIPFTIQERTLPAIKQNQNAIVNVKRQSIEMGRRNAANFRTLQDLLFDPDGYFDTTNIKPGSIETNLLSVGARSQNFNLDGVVITPNLLGNANELLISAGRLQHYEIEIPTLGYTWVLPTKTFSALDPAKPYFVYAKCSKTALTGEWMISDVPVFTDSVPDYYCFNLGILYSVDAGYRNFDLTKGLTTIVGDNITTGKIKDINGLNFFDLVNNQFSLGDPDSGLDWNVSNADQLTIRGALMANVVRVGSAGQVNAFISGATNPVNPTKSIRFGAGGDISNPSSLKFMVLDDGTMYAENAIIKGTFDVLVGNIGGFHIDGNNIVNLMDNAGIAIKSVDGLKQFLAGTNVLEAGDVNAIAVLKNLKTGTVINRGLIIKVAGAAFGNYCLDLSGGILMENKQGVSVQRDMRSTIGNVDMEFTNGILTRFRVF